MVSFNYEKLKEQEATIKKEAIRLYNQAELDKWVKENPEKEITYIDTCRSFINIQYQYAI